jgi:SAM-dependent methyltransferase
VVSVDPNEQRSGFQLAAGLPEHYERHAAPIMAPFVDALVTAVARPGQDLLDVACGTGFATRAAAAVVGEGGRVTGVDINGAMVALARSRPPAGGADVEWREASALDLPFDGSAFDAVVCQQGVQFFPDPVAGLAEMRRVTRDGGALGVTAWAPIAGSPYFAAQLGMLADTCGLPPAVVGQAFPPGGAEALADQAERAGWRQVETEVVVRRLELPPLADYIPAHLRALPWSAPFFDLDAERRAAAVDAMIEALRAHIGEDGVARVPTSSVLLVARR